MLLLLVGGATVHSGWFNRHAKVIHTRSMCGKFLYIIIILSISQSELLYYFYCFFVINDINVINLNNSY